MKKTYNPWKCTLERWCSCFQADIQSRFSCGGCTGRPQARSSQRTLAHSKGWVGSLVDGRSDTGSACSIQASKASSNHQTGTLLGNCSGRLESRETLLRSVPWPFGYLLCGQPTKILPHLQSMNQDGPSENQLQQHLWWESKNRQWNFFLLFFLDYWCSFQYRYR